MGGRIGMAKRLAGSLLNIKPLIGMQQGEIVALGQARSRTQIYRMILDRLETSVGSGKLKIAYVHAGAQQEVEKIKQLLESHLDVVESFIAELSPALAVHTGPGTTGLCYLEIP
jgi:DegV family protein with EDD domain